MGLELEPVWFMEERATPAFTGPIWRPGLLNVAVLVDDGPDGGARVNPGGR
jgi:hypothetical protein